jgi:inhibitor of KinA
LQIAVASRLILPMNWLRYGPNSLMLYFADRVGDEAFQRSRAICAELESKPPPGLIEFVPAFTSLLLEFEPSQALDNSFVTDLVARLETASSIRLPDANIREIPVIYDGPDLQRVAELNRLGVNEVIERHSAPTYKVYMLGFSPGFPYLGDLDARLRTPRLASPRTRVSPGSVAIGGEHTGIYTIESPGGWNLIGRTTDQIFDLGRFNAEQHPEAMFLLKPGDRVRFVPVERNSSGS